MSTPVPRRFRPRWHDMRPRFGLDAGRLIDQARETARDVMRFSGIARARAGRRAMATDAVFVWVPKTAGTSLWKLLQDNGGQKLIDPHVARWEFPDRGLVTFGHACYPAVRDAGIVSEAFDRRAYRFAVVRDPIDRAISLYEYLRRIDLLPSRLSFELFSCLLRDGGYEPVGLYNSDGLSQCNPQVAWLVGEGGDLVVHDVFRFERLDEAVASLRERFGLRGDLVRVNTTVRRDRGDYLSTPAIRRNIEAWAAPDLDRFASLWI